MEDKRKISGCTNESTTKYLEGSCLIATLKNQIYQEWNEMKAQGPL